MAGNFFSWMLRRACNNTTRCRAMLSGIVVLLLVLPISAAKAATPSEVYRAVSEVIAEVRLLHDANFSSADNGLTSIRPENRRPRHVLQMARTVLVKANLLATINGGGTSPVPPMPTREVTPSDVIEAVNEISQVVTGLKPIFGVQAAPGSTPAPGSKTPSDVYAALYQLSSMIERLGIPATVPNDVYQIADTIVFELKSIAKRYDIPLDTVAAKSAGKKPNDVYKRAFKLAAAMDNLIQTRPSLAPAGGIIMPFRETGMIKPEQVRYALNDILAEISAMKIALGDQEEVRPAPAPSGTTPSNVYDRLTEALRLVERMADNV